MDLWKLAKLLNGRDALEEVRTFIQKHPDKLNEDIVFDIVNFKEGTLLHFSCLWNRPKVVSYLLSQNADVTKCFKDINLINYEHKKFHHLTAQQIAENKNYSEIVTLFKTTVHQPQEQTFSGYQFFSTKAVGLIKQHLSEIMQTKNLNKRAASITFLEEKFEEEKLEKDVQLFKNLENILIDKIKDPFDFDAYSLIWCKYFPKLFSEKASCIVGKHLTDITTKKNEKTRHASFVYLKGDFEDQSEELKDDLTLLNEIEPKLNFIQFDINSYLAVFNVYLPQSTSSPIQGFPYGTASDCIDQINNRPDSVQNLKPGGNNIAMQNLSPSTIVSNTSTFNGGGMLIYRQALSPDHSILKMASIVAGAKPQFDCIHSLQLLSQFPAMSKIETVIEECKDWYEGWKYDGELNPYGLDKDEVFAIVTYTHDLYNKGQKEENFYFQLNEFLRRRLQSEMESWSNYLYFILTALKKLPDVEITIYRGIPACSMSKIQKEYKHNRPIHWSGFSSSSNNIDVAKQFAGPNGIIFCINIYTGKNIKLYSFVRSEDETLLSPNMKFKVTRALYDGGDGYQYVELEEELKEFVY